jgi:hypothetical protein
VVAPAEFPLVVPVPQGGVPGGTPGGISGSPFVIAVSVSFVLRIQYYFLHDEIPIH